MHNYAIVTVFSITGCFVCVFSDQIDLEKIRNILSVLLSLNGTILRLLIAGYSFSNSLPKDVMAFAISSKAEDYPWSKYKQILLNYLYCYIMLFTGILFFCFIYMISFIGFMKIFWCWVRRQLLVKGKSLLMRVMLK